jgi:hypothetical protein
MATRVFDPTGVYDGVDDLKKLKTFYEDWQDREGIPIHTSFYVDNMATVPVGPWKRFGARGCFINLADCHIVAAAILEIPPGGQTLPVKHMFETWCFVVQGRGETTFEQPGTAGGRLEWDERGLFGPPLNTTYQHRNLDPAKPARILMVTNAPVTMNLYHSDEFIFENPFVFKDRFRGQNDFFNPVMEYMRPKYLGARVLRSNLVPDVLETALAHWALRGHAAKTVHLSMSDNTMAAHISDFEVGTYKKAHRHGPGAHVILLQGTGYSLIWKEGEPRRRVDWKPGTMFAPPEWYFHQHFNTGKEPARYLALRRGGSPEHKMKIGMSGGEKAEGPDQIEYEYEDPAIYDEFVAELKKNGAECRQPRPAYASGPRPDFKD